MLPNVKEGSALRCRVISKRTGRQCKNPAAYGQKACRFHGAHRSVTKLVGKDNPAYKHGKETNKARLERRERIKELQELENAGRKLGMIVGPKTRGRKVK
jgi:hypothetical protein